MRWRLYLTYLPLLAAAVLAMAYPLTTDVAARYSQAMYIDRADDTARFASVAETALRTGRTAALHAELRQYDTLSSDPGAARYFRETKVWVSGR